MMILHNKKKTCTKAIVVMLHSSLDCHNSLSSLCPSESHMKVVKGAQADFCTFMG